MADTNTSSQEGDKGSKRNRKPIEGVGILLSDKRRWGTVRRLVFLRRVARTFAISLPQGGEMIVKATAIKHHRRCGTRVLVKVGIPDPHGNTIKFRKRRRSLDLGQIKDSSLPEPVERAIREVVRAVGSSRL